MLTDGSSSDYLVNLIELEARLLCTDIRKLIPLTNELPKTAEELIEELKRMNDRINSLQAIVREVDAPVDGLQMRSELLKTAEALQRAFAKQLHCLEMRQFELLRRPSANYSRALKAIVRLGSLQNDLAKTA
jgi:hypothetical protein